MRSLYVDTGVWLALIDTSDPHHARARSIFDSHRGFPLCGSDLVLSECVTLLARRFGADRAADFGSEFVEGREATLLRCEREDWIEGLALIRKFPEQRLSFADATSFAIVRRFDIEKAASFDKHFRIVLPEREVIGPE